MDLSLTPYLHAFDELSRIHHQIELNELRQILSKLSYQCLSEKKYPPKQKETGAVGFSFYTLDLNSIGPSF